GGAEKIFDSKLGLSALLQEFIHVDWAGSHAELLHHAELVPVVPTMDELPVCELNDGDGRDIDLALGGWESQPVTFVSAGYAQAYGHLVAFSYRVFDGDVQIREGASHVAHK